MFRVILSFVLTLFLFVGIIGTASFIFSGNRNSEQNLVVQNTDKSFERISIREIETISATNNLRFTSKNALR